MYQNRQKKWRKINEQAFKGIGVTYSEGPVLSVSSLASTRLKFLECFDWLRFGKRTTAKPFIKIVGLGKDRCMHYDTMMYVANSWISHF